MSRGGPPRPPRPARSLIASDALAILVFITIGLVSHHGDVSATGYARDGVPFLGCWFVAARLFRLYRSDGKVRLLLTWAVAVPLAVLIRALILGRSLNGKEAAFLTVSLVTIGALVVAFRLALARLPRRG